MPGQEASELLARLNGQRLKTMEEGSGPIQCGGKRHPDLSPPKSGWVRFERELPVAHRSDPLRVLVLHPSGARNGRLAVISHGLWDDPESFEGWGEFLAAAGYTVLLPDHPGSDFSQQQAMLSGDRPPPGPEELRLRPQDVSSLLDALQSGQLTIGHGLNTRSVAVIGHSWGATTSLQLAGGIPTDRKLKARCRDQTDLNRNISWVLQCSWLSGIAQAGEADPRVRAVVAVSPPLGLLFNSSSASGLSAKVLLVSGTRLGPFRPEAPCERGSVPGHGHRIVLDGADHFCAASGVVVLPFSDRSWPGSMNIWGHGSGVTELCAVMVAGGSKMPLVDISHAL